MIHRQIIVLHGGFQHGHAQHGHAQVATLLLQLAIQRKYIDSIDVYRFNMNGLNLVIYTKTYRYYSLQKGIFNRNMKTNYFVNSCVYQRWCTAGWGMDAPDQ